MKKLYINIRLIILLSLSFVLNGSLYADNKGSVNNEEFIVFVNEEGGVPYRIPAIASTKDGDLIAVADYRYSKADIGVVKNGKIDLRYRIRDGKTGEWGEVMTLAAARGEGDENIAFGDPCIVADSESDLVLVTSCVGNIGFSKGTHENHMGWARFISEDGGKTWSDYEDIADQVFRVLDNRSDGNINTFFIGSGKILQSPTIKTGDFYRLYCAAVVKTGDNTIANYVFYSDDFGKNWKLLGTPDNPAIPSEADEPKVDELPDGSVLISSRISGGRIYNIYHFTDVEKGEGEWNKPAISNTLNKGVLASASACNGETLCIPVVRNSDGESVFLLLQSVPMHENRRRDVGINYKELADINDYKEPEDLAKDWDGLYQVSDKSSAYSTMIMDKANKVAFLYEENANNGGYDIVFKEIPIEKITKGAYTYRADK